MKILRRILILALLSGLYLLVVEALVRWRWPQDKETVFLAAGSLGMQDAVLGHKLRPESWSRTRTPEFTVDYRVNTEGWRDAALYPPEKTRAGQRVLLLGDSFTFGEGAPYEAIWPVVLEAALRQSEVEVELIKAGVPGYDTRREVLLLEQMVERYRPDAVLLAFVPNDLFTNLADKPTVASSTAPQSSEPATVIDTEVITAHEEKKRRPSLHSLSLLQRLVLRIDRLYVHLYRETGRARYFTSRPDAVLAQQLTITEGWLERGRRFCAARGVAFGVLSIPQQVQVLASARGLVTPELEVTALDEHFDRFATERGFIWTALLPELTRRYVAAGEDLYFRRDGHLNARGHRVVADWLVERWGDLGLEVEAAAAVHEGSR